MLAALLAASLALQEPPMRGDIAFANRTIVEDALRRAQLALDRIGHCMTQRSGRAGVEMLYDERLSVLRDVIEAARALYPDIAPVSETIPLVTGRQAPRCDGPSVRSYDAAARQAIDDARAHIDADAALLAHGLWVGTLHLCAGRVAAVEVGAPEFHGGRPGLILRFSRDFAPRIRALTARWVGRPLAVVLDGIVIMSPIVNEPLDGAASIAGPEAVPIDRIRAAAAEPC
jgi:hypothetical protein